MSGAIPKSFFPFLTTFSDFSRKKVRINTIGKDTANPGEITSILLNEGKFDMSTFSLGGLVSTSTTANYAHVPNIECMIEQIMVEVGSVQLHPSLMYYGQIWTMLSDLQGSWGRAGQRAMINAQPISSTVVGANHTNVPFQLTNFLGFLNDAKVLLTDRLPPVRIYIRWAQPNVLVCASSTTGATYSISNMYCLVDALKLSPVYDELLSSKIAQSPLQMPYTNWQVVPGVQSGLTSTVRFSSTADSLEKVFTTFIPTTYQNLNQVKDTVTYLSPAFTRGSANLNSGFTSRLTINGHSFPDQAAVAERGEIFLQTLQTLNEHKDVTSLQHPNLTSLTNFASKFFAHGVDFTWNDADSPNRKCGLSALGQNLIGSWEYVGTAGQADTVQPLVILQTKSVLEIGPNRTIRVIY
jgi:hypothetical protein